MRHLCFTGRGRRTSRTSRQCNAHDYSRIHSHQSWSNRRVEQSVVRQKVRGGQCKRQMANDSWSILSQRRGLLAVLSIQLDSISSFEQIQFRTQVRYLENVAIRQACPRLSDMSTIGEGLGVPK
jgi:hypothetical protein